jgi:TATA-binding protein-associated factor Taf7
MISSPAIKPKGKTAKLPKKSKPVPQIGESGVEDDEAEDLGVFEAGSPKSDEKSSDEKDSEEEATKQKDDPESDDASPEDDDDDDDDEERDEPSKEKTPFCPQKSPMPIRRA